VVLKSVLSLVALTAFGITLGVGYSAAAKATPAADKAVSTAIPGFSIQVQDGSAWLVRPDGRRFFSLGVCCVDMGASPSHFTSTNPSYAAWQHYATSNQWAEATLKRLKRWGFTTVGGWSDFPALKQVQDMNLAFTPVLHIGSTAGAPWWDMWGTKVMGRMDEVAREHILALRDDPHLLGYYTDNEMGWWNAALFTMTLQHVPTSGQRQRLIELLRSTYHRDWAALLKDFEPEGVASWEALDRGGMLYLRPGGSGLQTVHEFLGMMAERYYSLAHEIIRKYDHRALILGDRYQSFFFPEVARACARHVDAVSSNLNPSWNDGSFPRFYLDTLHALTGKPILVSEFYMTARQNRSGDRNSSSGFPVAATQIERAAGFGASLRALLKLPYVIGADWFQYYDEPPFGRYDGEDYNFGLVDIYDRPYARLTEAAARLDLMGLKARSYPPRLDASHGVPRSPRDPLGRFQPASALQHWDRERGFVKPASELPVADLYVCWDQAAFYVGLYSQDVVENAFYRDKIVPEEDRAEWTFLVKGSPITIRSRIGAGLEPHVNPPEVRIVNASGVNWKARNIAAMALPARLFGLERFAAGGVVEFSSVLLTHCRGYRTEWGGSFRLARE
jgi:hypothetical protein